jgi:hypothetical protein
MCPGSDEYGRGNVADDDEHSDTPRALFQKDGARHR